MLLCVIKLQTLFCKTTDEPTTSANTPHHKTASDFNPQKFSLLCPKLCRTLQSISSVNELLKCEFGDSQLKNTSTTCSHRVTTSYILRSRLIQPLTSHRTKIKTSSTSALLLHNAQSQSSALENFLFSIFLFY